MLTAIDLFAGAGGLSTGLELAGFDILFANEISEVFSESLKYNHPRTEVAIESITELDPKNIRKSIGLQRGELDLIAGGPPCQGFSVNAPVRSKDDKRNHLFLDYLRFVEEFNPKAVLIENVPGMISFEKGDTVRSILKSLNSLGYNVDVRILYAPHFGVPQMRWRTIFLANRINAPALSMFPEPFFDIRGRANFATSLDKQSLVYQEHNFENAEDGFVSVADAISDLPEIPNRGGHSEMDYCQIPETAYQRKLRKDQKILFNHQCAGLGKANLQRLHYIPQGGSWRDIPHDLLPTGMKRAKRSDHTQRYGRLELEGIGSTILTKCDPHWGRFIHPTQDRVLSVREAARIQSFPDNCKFFGNLVDQYKQVGNAVPPIFAESIGLGIKNFLEADKVDRQLDSSQISHMKGFQEALAF